MKYTLKETALKCMERIRERNETLGAHALPVSDTVYRDLFHEYCNSKKESDDIIKVLIDSHHIFVIHMVEKDEHHGVDGLDGLLVAEQMLVQKLKDKSFQELAKLYEGQFYKRKPAGTIIRELIPNARQYNNTPLGKALNISNMLSHFEQILTEHHKEYLSEWKSQKLNELCQIKIDEANIEANKDKPKSENGEEPSIKIVASPFGEKIETPVEEKKSSRAVDQPEYKEIEKMNLSGLWGESVSMFGVQFLVRIHLRKLEFEALRQLIRTNRIAKNEDLRFIRDSIRKMEERVNDDTGLLKNYKEMLELKKFVQARMNKINN